MVFNILSFDTEGSRKDRKKENNERNKQKLKKVRKRKTFALILHAEEVRGLIKFSKSQSIWKGNSGLCSFVQGDVTVGLDYGQVCADMTERLVTVFMAQVS